MIKTVVRNKQFRKKYGCDCYYHYNESCYEWEEEPRDRFDKRVNAIIEDVKGLNGEILEIEYLNIDEVIIKYQ